MIKTVFGHILLIISIYCMMAANVLNAQTAKTAANATDSKGMKQGAWQKLGANGKMVYEGQFKDNIPQGVFNYYYEDGKLRTVLTYSLDGKKAVSVSYHPNGKKMAEGDYFETKKDGIWKYYSDLETLASEEFYQNGVAGGTWKLFYESGGILEECPYKNGAKDGRFRQFFTDGEVKSEIIFVKGKYEGKAIFYFPGGKPLMTGRFLDDLKEGLWTTYKESGDKESEIEYAAGVIIKEKYYDKAREAELKNDVTPIPE